MIPAQTHVHHHNHFETATALPIDSLARGQNLKLAW